MFKLSYKPKETLDEPEETRLEEMDGLDEHEEPGSFDQEANPEVPSRFFYQVMIAGLCLAMLLMMAGVDNLWIRWAKVRLHNAFLATSESTFGYLADWGPLKSLLQSGKSLIKFDEITKQLSSGEEGWNLQNQDTQNVALPNPVWPVQGNVSRGFGWQYNPAKKAREFNEGIEILTSPGDPVQALADGQVVEISRLQDFSWQITLNHGNGWISVYRNLGLAKVKVGENVPSGMTIGSINTFGPSGSKLWVQVKHNDQPVDPMALFTNRRG